jgi:hypothetical protein
MSENLTYQIYNDKSFAVYGNKEKYKNILKSVSARWNPRLKDNGQPRPGWIVSKEKEDELKKIISSVNSENIFSQKPETKNEPEPKSEIKPIKNKKQVKVKNESKEESNSKSSSLKSRKEQHKYHRSFSNDSLYKISEEKSKSPIKTKNSKKKKSEESEISEAESEFSRKSSPRKSSPKKRYTSPVKKTKFRELYDASDSETYSSSDDSQTKSESDDDFPESNSPKKKNVPREYQELYRKMADISKQIITKERKKERK